MLKPLRSGFPGAFLLFLSLSLNAGLNERNGFRPNKGQWHQNVAFRTDLPNGKLYLEEKGFTFDLYEGKRMAEFLGHHHGKDAGKGPKSVPFHAYRVRFQNSTGPTSIDRKGKSRSYANYYLSNDPEDWASKVHAYRKVRYRSLYEGIDLKLRKKQGKGALKYDLIISPKGDPADIQLLYKGMDRLDIDDQGRLLVRTSVGTVKEARPKAYQRIDGEKVKVPCRYELNGNELEFRFPEGYKGDHELVIDPTLIFSTYSGSGSDNFGYTATFDDEGFLYSGSTAFGNSYPTTSGAYQQSWAGGTGAGNLTGTDIAISKYDTSGTYLVWSTYLGGSSDELPHSMIVNENDELFVYGTTSSPDFPVTPSAYDTSFSGGNGVSLNGIGVDFKNGADIIVSRISNDGTALMASTFIGGSANDGLNTDGDLRYNYADEVRGEIIIDDKNRCYIASTTRSTDFPTTSGTYKPNAPSGNQNGCLIKLDNSLTTLLWSTYFGGSGKDAIYSLTLDKKDNLFITGGTTSQNLNTDSTVIQPQNAGGRADAYVAHMSSNGDSLIRASYWGSPEYDQSYFVRLDSDDDVHLFGQTEKMDSTFIIDASYAQPHSGQYITQMSTELDSVIWSTVFGAGDDSVNISPTAFLVDVCHKIYLSGWGGGANDFSPTPDISGSTKGMDITNNAYQDSTDGSDFYLMVLRNDASGIEYGSYMGGPKSEEHVDGGTSRFDKKGHIYQSVCAGCGNNSDFPIKPDPGAVSPTNNSQNCNNAVFKIDFGLPIAVADLDHPGVTCKGDSVSFTNKSKGGHDLTWLFGDGDSSTTPNPDHVYDSAGVYQITLYVRDSNTCNLMDSAKSSIQVLSDTSRSLGDSAICFGGSVSIGLPPSGDTGVSHQWDPSAGLSDPNEPNPVASPDSTTDYELYVSNGVCTDTIRQTVKVSDPRFSVPNDTFICHTSSDSLELEAASTPPSSIERWTWTSLDDPKDTLNDGASDSSIMVLPKDSTRYLVFGEEGGCPLRDTVAVNVGELSLEQSNDTTICWGDTSALEADASGNGTIHYDWEPDASILQGDSSDQITIAPKTSTTYSITVSDDLCTTSRAIDVGVSDLSQKKVEASSEKDSIVRGSSTKIHAEPDDYDVRWTPPTGLEDPESAHTEASPTSSTTYRLRMTDAGACPRTDMLRIIVQDITCGEPNLFLPNAFSPNGDGENDVLYVRGRNIEKMTLRIFDRWGEKVFESHDPDNGWDGRYEGKLLDPDVYAYYLEITCTGGKEFFEKGNITLLR